jgi:filamin
VEVIDNKDGTYAASYMPLDPGPYKVEVLLNGAPVAKSPFTVNIDKNPNEPDASKCRAYGPGLEGGNTAEPAVFFVEVNTPSGKRYTGGDAPIAVDITDPAGNVVPVEKSTKEDGVLQFSYSPKDVGTYKVDVVLRNKHNPTFYEHVPGSTFHVPIEAGTDANNTIAYGPGVEGPVLDTEPTHFTIEARDNKGNKLPKGGDPFEVTVAGPNGNVPAEVHDNGDGTYNVKYAANEPGPHKVHVNLKGKPIKHAPFTVNVEEGADADHSGVETYTFTIRAKSKRGGNLTTGGNRFTVDVNGPKGANPTTKVVDHNDGTYTVSYSLPEPGTYKIAVKVNGKHISGSPWKQEAGE